MGISQILPEHPERTTTAALVRRTEGGMRVPWWGNRHLEGGGGVLGLGGQKVGTEIWDISLNISMPNNTQEPSWICHRSS